MADKLTHNQVLELLPAYALGALEPDEMLAVDAYLAEYPALSETLRELEESITYLTHLAPETPLPDDGKARLMARVQQDLEHLEQAPDTTFGQTAPSSSFDQTPAGPAKAGERAGRLLKLWAALGSRGWSLATAGLTVALVIAVIYIGQLQSAANDLQAQSSQAQQDLAALQAEILSLTDQYDRLSAQHTTLESDYTALQTKAEALQQAQSRLAFVADASQIVIIPATDVAPGASATFYSDARAQLGLLVLRDLAPLPQSETYQLWLIPPEGTPVSAGLVSTEPGQPTWNDVSIPPMVQEYIAVGVSREPAGGSPSPTSIVLLGNVS